MPPRFQTLILAIGVIAACLAPTASAQQVIPTLPRSAESQQDGPTVVVLTKGIHRRVVFEKEIARTALGDPETVTIQTLSSRELLILAVEVGRTSLIVWFDDGTSIETVYEVEVDLSVLREALRDIHPNIEARSAPDREAIVLRGTVPDVSYSIAAEDVANRYLSAVSGGTSDSTPLIAAGGEGSVGADVLAEEGAGGASGAGSVINLLKLDKLPATAEEQILELISGIEGVDITVRRILSGVLPDDETDTLILEGTVPNQVALMQTLTISAQIFGGGSDALSDISVLADESGALAGQTASGTASGQTGLGNAGGGSALGGSSGSSAQALRNRVESNLGRAKAIELAGGRILSFIKVTDLPQVRVQIRLLQVNRTRLRSYGSDILLDASNTTIAPSDATTPGNRPARFPDPIAPPAGAAIIESLSGNFAGQFQLATNEFVLDQVLSALESRDIAKSLSEPSLMVLSGEIAFFQVGGQVPVPVNFSPAFGSREQTDSTPGVFNSVQFAQFGVQLGVRPLVDENDIITLDVIPQIVTPDVGLTETIRDSTGTDPATLAFETRSLRTSARLADGQVLLIGGLLSSSQSDGDTETPGLSDIPIAGNLFRGFTRSDDELELVILVNPVIVREQVHDLALWSFPGGPELMVSAGLAAAPPEAEPQPLLE